MTKGREMGPAMALADRRHPRRLSVDLSEEMHRGLRRAAAEDDISVAHRIRALIQLWNTDAAVREAANGLAAQMKAAERDQGGAQVS